MRRRNNLHLLLHLLRERQTELVCDSAVAVGAALVDSDRLRMHDGARVPEGIVLQGGQTVQSERRPGAAVADA